MASTRVSLLTGSRHSGQVTGSPLLFFQTEPAVLVTTVEHHGADEVIVTDGAVELSVHGDLDVILHHENLIGE